MSGSSRILFRSLHVYREARRAETQVELWNGAQALVGTANGLAVHGGLPTLVARATLEALRGAIDPHLDVDLVGVERKRMGHRSLMLTHLVVLEGREERHLSGSVLITSDALEATVFSVLDALNRILDFGAVQVVPEHRPVDGIHDEFERRGRGPASARVPDPSPAKVKPRKPPVFRSSVSESESRSTTQSDSQPESRRESRPESQPEPRSEARPEAQSAARPASSRDGRERLDWGGLPAPESHSKERDANDEGWQEFQVDSVVPRQEEGS